MATMPPATRLNQSDCRPDALTSSAIVLNVFASNNVFHQSRLNGARNGKVSCPVGPWKERIAIRIIGMYRKNRKTTK